MCLFISPDLDGIISAARGLRRARTGEGRNSRLLQLIIKFGAVATKKRPGKGEGWQIERQALGARAETVEIERKIVSARSDNRLDSSREPTLHLCSPFSW